MQLSSTWQTEASARNPAGRAAPLLAALREREMEDWAQAIRDAFNRLKTADARKGAARRAARLADGFFPARPDLLPDLLAALRDECARIGRDPEEVEISTMMMGRDLDAVRRMQDLGVARLVMGPPAFDDAGLDRALGEFADRILAKV